MNMGGRKIENQRKERNTEGCKSRQGGMKREKDDRESNESCIQMFKRKQVERRKKGWQ